MAKQEVYWFHHDGNARRDQKILTMRSVYGYEGYGWWWALIEMMREACDYKLRYSGKHDMKTMAIELSTTPDRLTEYINDCAKEFGLFQMNETHFWSPSLNRRMATYDATCEKRRIAGARSHMHD